MDLEYKALSKIFNSGVLTDIAKGDLSYVLKIVNKFFPEEDTELSLKELYEKTYQILLRQYPNEYIYKNLIANKILLGRHSLNTATMLSEFRVGTNKADCVILNGKSTCYEIKTDYDSLVRLDDQLDAYTQVFDDVYVVCSQKHVKSILEKTKASIGVIFLSEKMTFQEIRKAHHNEIKNKKLLLQSLRKNEYMELVQKLTGEVLEAPNTQLFDLCLQKLYLNNDEKKLNSLFIETLKKSRKNNEHFITHMPNSLVNAIISYKFNKLQIRSLIDYFATEEKLNVLSNITRKA